MKKILVAEDDAFLQDLTEARLLQAGYEVLKVSDGDDVVDKVLEVKPDLILLDIQLPHRTGMEILTEIRTISEIKDTPVILFTNESGLEIEEAAKKLNAQYFMKAMTGTGELLEAVASTIVE